jgi:hypothetical protein
MFEIYRYMCMSTVILSCLLAALLISRFNASRHDFSYALRLVYIAIRTLQQSHASNISRFSYDAVPVQHTHLSHIVMTQ